VLPDSGSNTVPVWGNPDDLAKMKSLPVIHDSSNARCTAN